MALHRVTPILSIFDESKARAFYIDFLGFSIDWEHRFEANFPLYLQISKDDCILHLSEHHGDGSPSVGIRIATSELEGYCQQLINTNYAFAKPTIETMPWGGQEFMVIDPFGNRLAFYSFAQEGTL